MSNAWECAQERRPAKIRGAEVLFSFWPELPVNWRDPLTPEQEWDLVKQFRPGLMEKGYETTPHYTARCPFYNRTTSRAHVWHRDGERRGRKFCVWASNGPTEVMDEKGTLLDAKNGDVILIQDDLVVHRAQVKPSWFVRVGVAE